MICLDVLKLIQTVFMLIHLPGTKMSQKIHATGIHFLLVHQGSHQGQLVTALVFLL